MEERESLDCKATKWRMDIKTEDNFKFPPPRMNPWVRLGIYITMTFLTGCVYWGWNGIQALLYKAGSFEEVCEGVSNCSYIKIGSFEYIDCGARKSSINNLFTIAYSAQLISSIFTGMLLDYIGPKFTYMVGQFTNFICWIMISSVPKNPLVLRVCFFFIGCTTESLYMPLSTVSHYFPGNQSLILSSLGSTRSISIVIPILLSKIYALNYFGPDDLYKVGIGYAVICNFFCLFVGALIIQRKFYIAECQDKPDKFDAEVTMVDNVQSYEDGINAAKCLDSLSYLKSIHKHPKFLEFVILVLVTMLFLASIEFINKSHRDLLVTTSGRTAADIFKYIHAISFIPGPLIGFLMDKFGAPIVFVFIQFSCLNYFICSITNYYFLKVLACIFFLFACSLCLSDTYCYIRQRFSPIHFGVLNGICFFAAGLFSLTNIPLYNLAAKKLAYLSPNNFRPIAMIQMAYMVVCMLMSVMLVFITKTPQYCEES